MYCLEIKLTEFVFVRRSGFFNISIKSLSSCLSVFSNFTYAYWFSKFRNVYKGYDKIWLNNTSQKSKAIFHIHFSSKAFTLIISLDGLKIMSTILDCGPFKSRPVRGHLYGYYYYYYRCYYRTNPIFHSLEKHAKTDFYIQRIIQYITQSFCNYLY